MLIMFLAGAMAMWFIVRLATKNSTPPPAVKGSEASYANLKQSILKP